MIVVDSAAVVDALTMVDGSERLREELGAGNLHAPSLLDFEVVSALRGLTLGGHLSATRAADALADFDALPVERWPSAPALRLRSFGLRANLSAYDAAYIALARLTADRALAEGLLKPQAAEGLLHVLGRPA